MYTLEEKVETGAQLLDLHKPDWYRAVDTRTLDMQSVDCCILGQCFESYSYGKKALGIQLGEGSGFALNSLKSTTHYERRMEWKELRNLWIEEVEVRLVAEEIAASDDIGLKTEEELSYA